MYFCKCKNGNRNCKKQIVNRHEDIQERILKRTRKVGGCIRISYEDVCIWNLITKEMHYDKPTYENLRKSLIILRKKLRKYEISEIALPKIGCGCDKLEWLKVRKILEEIFCKEEIQIYIYSLVF